MSQLVPVQYPEPDSEGEIFLRWSGVVGAVHPPVTGVDLAPEKSFALQACFPEGTVGEFPNGNACKPPMTPPTVALPLTSDDVPRISRDPIGVGQSLRTSIETLSCHLLILARLGCINSNSAELLIVAAISGLIFVKDSSKFVAGLESLKRVCLEVDMTKVLVRIQERRP